MYKLDFVLLDFYAEFIMLLLIYYQSLYFCSIKQKVVYVRMEKAFF